MHHQVGGHFAVSSEGRCRGGPRRQGDRVAESSLLDRRRVERLPTTTIPVVLYTTQQFRDITRSPEWAAGAYDGTIRVPMRGALDDEKELDRVLSHEFAHALVRTLSAAAIPTWLNEGLATVFESNDLEWAEHRVAQSKPVGLDVLAVSFGRFTGGQAQLAHARRKCARCPSYALREGRRIAVANLIRDPARGLKFDRAFTPSHAASIPRISRLATSETAHTQ
jgi:hypothetical protein